MTERMNEPVGVDDELQHLIATHAIAGMLTIESQDGETIVETNITFDHRKVGDLLNPSGNHGSAQLDEALFRDLSPEQEAVRQRLELARADQEIDLL